MLDPWKVKVFVHRERPKAGHDEMTEAINGVGIKYPAQVRDIRKLPREERMEDGRLCDWGLVWGEGRMLSCRRLKKQLPATITDASEADVMGRFLIENMQRKPLPWFQKAKLVKAALDGGKSIDEAAKQFFITPAHVYRLERITRKTAVDLESDVAAMGTNDAEDFLRMAKTKQTLVVQVLRDDAKLEVRDVMRKVEEMAEEGEELSLTAVKASLKRVEGELEQLRSTIKVTRLHHSLGPGNLLSLLKKKFRKALLATGVNITRFEEITAE